MKKNNILIVEDEETSARTLEKFLSQKGMAVQAVFTGEDGLAACDRFDFDAVLLDYRLPGISGEEVFARLKTDHPLVPVIFMTAYGEVERAVRLLKMGAFYYLTKPVELEELLHLIREAVAKSGLSRENALLRSKLDEKYSFDHFLYNSPIMTEVVNLSMRVARSSASVLITGESGTGKEVLANLIHHASERKQGPFVKVSLAALPSTLIEAELFGAEKGAFTGAGRLRIGRFEEADRGTLFLDEIGDLPLETQVKLLRVIQEREIVRLGSNSPVRIDVRLIAATHKNLEREITTGAFREDLYFRINVITIRVPALRERMEEVPFLVDFFIKKFAVREKKQVGAVSREALSKLLRYHYPGNIRELENIIERAVVLCRGEVIIEEDLPLFILGNRHEIIELEKFPLPERLKEIERRIILESLQKNGFVQTRTARDLGISESTLRYKIETLGIGKK